MPLTQQDFQPFINLSLIPSYNPSQLGNYANYGSIPTTGGMQQSKSKSIIPGIGNGMAGGLMTGDLLGGFLFDQLFGKSKPSWKPYQNDGQYYWTNPSSSNPVPIASVPGAQLSPNASYKTAANNAQAIQDILPYISNAINQTAVPGAIANLQAQAATSPGQAQLMTELYNTYGPALNAIGNTITQQNMMANQSAVNDVLSGPGSQTVNAANALQQSLDPQFYATRQQEAGRIGDLMNSIDLSGKLSDSERNEIAQGNARESVARGTLNAPSNTDTVANAMTYGQAGYGRQQQARSNLSSAIQQSSAFLPASKSGVDAFQVATGKSSMPNPGAGYFPGVNSSNTNNQYGLAGNLLSGMNNVDVTGMNIAANKKDWMDQFSQMASGIGSIMGATKGLGLLGCWVAREIYGEENPKWIMFRHWLFVYAPKWFKQLYLENGARFAKFISNKPILKNIIKRWMDSKI